MYPTLYLFILIGQGIYGYYTGSTGNDESSTMATLVSIPDTADVSSVSASVVNSQDSSGERAAAASALLQSINDVRDDMALCREHLSQGRKTGLASLDADLPGLYKQLYEQLSVKLTGLEAQVGNAPLCNISYSAHLRESLYL